MHLCVLLLNRICTLHTLVRMYEEIISLYLEIFSSEVAAQELVMTRQNDDREGNQELQNPVKAYEQLLFSARSTFTCIKLANH